MVLRSAAKQPKSSKAGGLPGRNNRRGRHVDYGLLQEENRRRGELGEKLVFRYEQDFLRQAGRPDLAGQVRWVSKEDGDGVGYDISPAIHKGACATSRSKPLPSDPKLLFTYLPQSWTLRGVTETLTSCTAYSMYWTILSSMYYPAVSSTC
jgi:hypothetical protein